MILHLSSVGTFIDTSTLLTYPELSDGTPDYMGGTAVHFEDIESEWFDCLSYDDSKTLCRAIHFPRNTQGINNEE